MSKRSRNHETQEQPLKIAVEEPRITQYSVVSEVNFRVFCVRVERAIADGWRLQGGVFIGEYLDTATGIRKPGWHQAMTMES